MKCLITGCGGFAGSHFLEHVLHATNWDVVATDSFRHKGKTDRITDAKYNWNFGYGVNARVEVITHDLTAPFSSQAIDKMGQVDYIVAYASESHVDRSISDPVPFCQNNVNVALSTLELARRVKPKALVWVSTDEVYGPVEEWDTEGHEEWAPILPSNPYAASKAAQEALAISYWRTYGVPLILVNCMNMIGERQDPEKFVPLVLKKVLAGETVKIHAQDENHIGTRHYLHARNLADGITFLLDHNKMLRGPAAFGTQHWSDAHPADRPDRYNIATPDRIDNLAMAKMIAEYAGKILYYELEDFHATRPGHDAHYGLDPEKMTNFGWTPPVALEDSLKRTIRWTLSHPEWLLEDN